MQDIIWKSSYNSHASFHAFSIAGFDPSCFAGLTADMRTFEALGVSGFAVATAITIQTPKRFSRCESLSGNLIKEQYKMLMKTFGAFPLKIGLVPNLDCRNAILTLLDDHNEVIVLDPVLEASAGKGLSDLKMEELARLFSRASLITPNVPEAEALLKRRIGSLKDLKEAATEIRSTYNCCVLLKGGHLMKDDFVWDVLSTNAGEKIFKHDRLPIAAHGSGCFLSAAIVAFCALGFAIEEAIEHAENYMSKAFSNPRFVGGFPMLSIRS